MGYPGKLHQLHSPVETTCSCVGGGRVASGKWREEVGEALLLHTGTVHGFHSLLSLVENMACDTKCASRQN